MNGPASEDPEHVGARDRATANRRLALLLAGNVLFGAGLFVHAFLFNFYLRELNLAATVMGHQVAAMTIGGLAALLPAGMLIDRRGARVVMLCGVAAAFLGLVLTAVLRNAAAIYVAAFAIGLGGAGCRVSWGPAIMRLTTASTRSRAFTWNAALLIATGALWVYASGTLAGWSGRVAGVPGLSGTQVMLLAGAMVSAGAALCYLPLRELDVAGARAVPGLARTATVPALPRDLAIVVGCVALWMLAAALVLPFYNVFFTDTFALTVGQVGTLFAGAKIATALLLVGAAELARRRGAYAMLLVWCALMAPALAGLALTQVLPLAIALYVAQGVVAPATNPLIDQLLLERAPAERHGVVAGWRNAAAEGAGAAGASAGGKVLAMASYPALFLVAAGVAAVSAVALGVALRPRAGAPAAIPAARAEPA